MRKLFFLLLLFGVILLSVIPCYAQGKDISGRYNVKSYGAKGDGATDDTAAINAALAACKAAFGTLFIPAGSYYLATSIILDYDAGAQRHCRGIIGANGTILESDQNITMLKIDTANGGIADLNIAELTFQNTYNAGGNADIAIEIADAAAANALSHSSFRHLHFIGTTYGIRDTRGDTDLTAHMDWNTFSDLHFRNWTTKNVEYAIKINHGGGGTGNVFTNFSAICGAVCFEAGDNVVGIGDLTISNFQMGGDSSATGVHLDTNNGAYHDRIVIVDGQMDAGVSTALDIDHLRASTIMNISFGGAVTVSLPDVKDSIINRIGLTGSVALQEFESEDPSATANIQLRSGNGSRTPRVLFSGPWSVTDQANEPYGYVYMYNDNGGPGASANASFRVALARGDPPARADKMIVYGDGRVSLTGDVVTPSSCGTGPTVAAGSTAAAGKIKIGTGGATACVITPVFAWAAAPSCVAQNETTGNILKPVTLAGSLTITGTMSQDDMVNWICFGQS